MNGMPDNSDLDLGGERACWLDEVCPSCGGMGGHRAGCDAGERRGEAEARTVPGLPQSDVARLTSRTAIARPDDSDETS